MARDLTTFETFPFDGQLSPRQLAPPVDTEPARNGEGGADCHTCSTPREQRLWSDDHWWLELYEPSPFRGVVLLGPHEHVESIGQLPDPLAQQFGPKVAQVQRAIETLGDIGRVHVNVWGDGGAHLHIWFYPRPYGQLQLRGTFLPVWGLILPDLPTEVTRTAGERIAAAMETSATAEHSRDQQPS